MMLDNQAIASPVPSIAGPVLWRAVCLRASVGTGRYGARHGKISGRRRVRVLGLWLAEREVGRPVRRLRRLGHGQ
jgi:hypothetical protein